MSELKPYTLRILQSCAAYRFKNPCKVFKPNNKVIGCEKGLDTPLTEGMRTISECYECHLRWAEKEQK